MKMTPFARRLALPLLCTALVASPAMAKLNAHGRKIVKAVEAEQESAIALLARLVDQNSGTRNIAGVKKVRDMVRPQFEQLGFTVHWTPLDAVQRAGTLVAVHKGKPGTTKILLIGHLDTVFEADSPFQHFERHGETATGPGSSDDKGGIIVILTALRAMKAAGTLKRANITVILSGDEESAGSPTSISRADLIKAGKWADVALGFEGLAEGNGQDYGSIARRSVQDYTIKATGKTAHSSLIFRSYVGDGAAFEMARIIDRFRTELPEPDVTFNIGLLASGATLKIEPDGAEADVSGKTNIIPPVAIAKGDFRTLSVAQSERVRAKMRAIVADHLPGTSATITFKDGYPPMPPTAGNQHLLDELNVINADLGLKAMPALDPSRRGAGDISFVAADVDALSGFGTASSGEHTPRETVYLSTIPRQAERTALLITRLSRMNWARTSKH